MRKPHWLSVIITAACVGFANAREQGVKLPEIGSSAGEIMSQAEQHRYGASMLHEMRAGQLVLDDPLLTDYLNALGYRLVAHSDRPDLPFVFFIVRNNDINAFAAPGGYVGVNAGMITAAHQEAELAAVIAHEISHVTQQHLLRAFEDAQKASIPIALAMLGAVIASSHRNDDAGQAAIMSGVSLMQQRQINFTRHDEIEADGVGIQTLARSGFDPQAMANTFATLQKVMRVNGIDMPEFLRTHPVDTNRIADAKARAEQLNRESNSDQQHASATTELSVETTLAFLKAPYVLPKSGTVVNAELKPKSIHFDPVHLSVHNLVNHGEGYFELMRERVRVLSADTPNAMLSYYANNLRDNTSFDTPANRYGYAVALTLAHRPQEAIAELHKLIVRQPENLVFQLALAHAEDQSGLRSATMQRYTKLVENYPGNHAVALAFAETLLAPGDVKSARHAQELLRPLLDLYSNDPALQHSFARACELGGDKIRAGEAYAEAAYLNGHAEDALNQLKALLTHTNLTYYQRARIDARITDLTPLVLELRRRGTRESQRDTQGLHSSTLTKTTAASLLLAP